MYWGTLCQRLMPSIMMLRWEQIFRVSHQITILCRHRSLLTISGGALFILKIAADVQMDRKIGEKVDERRK